MSLYPWITVSESIPDVNNELNYKEYEVDPKTGRTTGRLLDGLAAVKAWAYRALKTQRLKYPIYTWDFGSDLENFVGMSLTKELAESEIRRTIEETLLLHPSITGITGFKLKLIDSKLYIECKIETVWGNTDIGLYTKNI